MAVDWQNLNFSYRDVNNHICYTWKNSKWDNGKLSDSPYFPIHIAATSLHYGQAAFEGLKAFRSENGKINIFRPDENAKRLKKSAKKILMPEVPKQMFLDAIQRVILANKEFIPPYKTGGSLYIRPLLIGTGPCIGVKASNEYKFIVLIIPVGSYYKNNLNPVDAIIIDGYDRSTPNGLGNIKVAGNYAASLKPAKIAKQKGFPINLYLNANNHQFIDEFGTSNFIAIQSNKYITPKSNSILSSITNLSLMQLAQDKGLIIEKRQISLDEIQNFDQIAACGTAVVITLIGKIYHNNKIYTTNNKSVNKILKDLHSEVLKIQFGKIKDKHQWIWQING